MRACNPRAGRFRGLECEHACAVDHRPSQYKCRACPASAHAARRTRMPSRSPPARGTLPFHGGCTNYGFPRNLFSGGSGRVLYELLDDLYDYCFPILDKIGLKLRQIDEEIDEITPRAKERVRDIHKVKQEIISYRKIVRPQRPTLRLLERGVERFLPQELELYFDDIVDASERIWDNLDNYKEVVEALEDTNESLINHQQNDILYVLTIFSVVMLPLTFITGFSGMNVPFPAFGTTHGFLVTVGLMVVTVVGMLGFFRWKRWL